MCCSGHVGVKRNDPAEKTAVDVLFRECCRCAIPDMPESDPAGKTAEDVLLRTFKTNSLTYYAEHST